MAGYVGGHNLRIGVSSPDSFITIEHEVVNTVWKTNNPQKTDGGTVNPHRKHPLPYWLPAALARSRNQYSRGKRKKKGGRTMNQDKFITMVRDGNTIIDILQSVPENKRTILAMMAEAFINGMITQERLAEENQETN
jgi:hypothetical protein